MSANLLMSSKPPVHTLADDHLILFSNRKKEMSAFLQIKHISEKTILQ